MSMMTLYLITRLDGLKWLFAAIIVISICATILFTAMKCTEVFDGHNFGKFNPSKWLNISIFSIFISIISLVFIPSTKEIAFIYLTSKASTYVMNNEELQKIPDNAFKLLNTKMEQYIEETLTETKKTVEETTK